MGKEAATGRSKKVENSPQASLFGWKEREARKRQAKRKLRFEDPSPEGIWIGRENLREFLSESEQEEVFEIREYLRGRDWSELERDYTGGGRRPYHPAALLGLVLFGMMEGKSSLRQLESMARSDVRCWWLTGGIFPDHSVIGRFLNRHEEELSGAFFEQLTAGVLERMGSGARRLAADGTLVQAAASRYRRVQEEAAQVQAEKARREAQAEPKDGRLRERAKAAEEVLETVRQRKRERRKQGHCSRSVAVSPSEPEAVIQPIKERFTVPAYRPSVMANPERVIVAQAVDAKSETEVVGQLLEQARRVSGTGVEELLCDPGYFQMDVLQECQRQGVGEVLCPPGPRWDEDQQRWIKRSGSRVLPKSEFHYDQQQDCYWCPAGQRLDRVGGSNDRGRPYYTYGGADCRNCELRAQCTSSVKGRTIKRYQGEELKEELATRMNQPESRERYRRRQGMVEPVFGELKHIQGLQRFRRRGLQRVRLEFSLHAMAHNLRRLLARSAGPFQPLLAPLYHLLKALRVALALSTRGTTKTHTHLLSPT